MLKEHKEANAASMVNQFYCTKGVVNHRRAAGPNIYL